MVIDGIIDANLLIYAYDEGSPFYVRSRAWFEGLVQSGTEVGIPFQAAMAFLRILTHPKLCKRPLPLDAAILAVDRWLSNPNVHLLDASAVDWRTFTDLCKQIHASGNVISDVHIAALTMMWNATLYTADRDFVRFPGLRVINPLQTP